MTGLIRIGALVLAFIYVVAGAFGVRAGLAAERGAKTAYAASSAEALELLDRGRMGLDAPETAWLAGEVAVGLADRAASQAEGLAMLDGAAGRYLEMTKLSAGSAYALIGLASVEERLEHAEQTVRSVDLASLASGPWAQVGSHGRLAVGLLRLAVAREPSLVGAHDALIATLLRHGLVHEAEAAAREAAHAAPALEYHPDLDVAALPPEVIRAFADGAHEALDAAPLASRERKLLYLGLLDERVGSLDRAVEDLRRAHAEPGGSIEHAESAYHLGRILARLGRLDEADAAWNEAESSEVFRTSILVDRARIDEAAGRADRALERVSQARRSEPRRLDLILWEARLLATSGNHAAAIDDLRWGVTVDATSRKARAALVRALIEGGDRATARRALAEFESALGAGDDTRELDADLSGGP